MVRGRYGPGDLDALPDGQLLHLIEFLPQRLALDEGHDIIEEYVRFPRIVEWQDVRMLGQLIAIPLER
jgi:hypothetical protein